MKKVISLFLILVMVVGIVSGMPVNVSGANSMVESAITWAVNIANDNNYGYSQVNRYGNPDYDCSSLVSTAFHNAGFNVACELNTSTMKDAFVNAGFTWIPASEISGFPSSCANLQRGDILLASGHTELYIGDGKNVGAHMDYNGIPGGIGGGSTWSSGYNAYRYGADEIDVCNYWNDNWLGVLRYEASVPVVHIDKSTTFIGTDTTFSFNAENATSVHLYIYQGTDKYFEGEFSPSETYTRQYFQIGHYSCYIVAHTSSGDIESAWLGFDVVNKPTISISSLETTIWTDTTFSFNAENATSVHLYIYQGTDKYFEGEFSPADTYIRQFGDATGHYCYIVAHYSWGDVESSKVYFNVLTKTYNVVYDANGGSGAPSSQTKTYGQTLTLSSTKPTRSGYTFLGWSTSSTATKATYSAGGSFNTDADTTLYAVWQKNHSHSYTGTITKSPTCTEIGVRTYKCSCGASYTQNISATGHTESGWLIDYSATVYEVGSKHKECTECGEVLETATIKQLKCSKPTLKTISNTSSGVKIAWGKVSGADTYRVYRKTKNGDWKYLGSTSKTYYTDKTAKSGTKYYYAIRARNEAGNSSISSSLSKYYLADPTLKTAKSTKTGVSLKWSKVTGASGYVVYRKTGDGSYKKLTTVKGNSKVTYVDKSAKKGKKYTYKVKAYYSKTYSAYSNTKTIKDKY